MKNEQTLNREYFALFALQRSTQQYLDVFKSVNLENNYTVDTVNLPFGVGQKCKTLQPVLACLTHTKMHMQMK